jgi:hypothetical protein
MSWLKDVPIILAKLLKEEPPYWIFLFVSSVFVITSLLAEYHFKEVWAFFLYSMIGTFWRHTKKDLKLGRVIYHIVNLGLIVGLFLYLGYL